MLAHPACFTLKSPFFVNVLSHADLVTCSVNLSGRTAGPSSLYSYLHPAPKNGQFRADLGSRPLA